MGSLPEKGVLRGLVQELVTAWKGAAEVEVKWYVPVEEEAMTEPKQLAYFYDKILADEETELDVDGSVAVPAEGDTRQHAGRAWRVEHVATDRTSPNALPIYCVYLKEAEN